MSWRHHDSPALPASTESLSLPSDSTVGVILSLGLQEKSWGWGEGEGWGASGSWDHEFKLDKVSTPKGGRNKNVMMDLENLQMEMGDQGEQHESQFKDYEYELGLYDGIGEGGYDDMGMDGDAGDADLDMEMEMDMGDDGGGFEDAGGGYDDD